jgi:putative peptidoglycan lipid II flippase
VTSPTGGRLARAAGLAGIATLASRVLGLARETVLAAIFGAGNEMDAFMVAFRLPNLVRDLFAEGAMSAALIPTFTRRLELSGKADAWRLGNHVINALVIVTVTLVALAMVFVRPIVHAYAGDYAAVPGKIELTTELTLVMLPFLTLAALAAAAMGMLNSLHYYFVPALAPATFNVAAILCAFLLVPLMPAFGWPAISAMAISVILGGLCQVAIQWPALRREGFRYRPALDFRDPALAQILVLMGPGAVGLAATQINIFVNTQLATGLGTGAVSWLNYAFRLMYLPIGLFGVSIATAVLPAAARHAALDDVRAVRETVSRGLGLMMTLNIPAALGLAVLATPIVRLLFERGQFLASDTDATAAALRFYAVGLVGYSTARIASPVFYTIGKTRVPMAASCVSMLCNLVASITLARVLGFRGLALGTSLGALANAVVLLAFLRRHLNGIEGRRLGIALLKVTIASLVMAAAAWFVQRSVSDLLPGSGVAAQAACLGAAIGAGILVLAVTVRLLRLEEFDEVRDLIRPYFNFSSVNT